MTLPAMDKPPLCPHGHEIAGDNVFLNPQGWPRCKQDGGAPLAPLDNFLKRLIEDNVRVATAIAFSEWRSAPHVLELEELVSLANDALVRAAGRWPGYCAENGYSPDRTEYFVAYAQRRCRGAIRDKLRADDLATRTSRTQYKALVAAGAENGASEAQLTEATGLSATEIRRTTALVSRRLVSLDGPEDYDTPAPISTEESVLETELKSAFVAAVRALEPLERVVIVLHYFLGLELTAIAQNVGVSESRIPTVHTSAALAIHSALALAATA